MLELSQKGWDEVKKRFIITMILFFIPIAQLYSALIAFPLFMIPEINSQSSFMGYTFAYFYPNNIITVLGFMFYYFTIFYCIAKLKERKVV